MKDGAARMVSLERLGSPGTQPATSPEHLSRQSPCTTTASEPADLQHVASFHRGSHPDDHRCVGARVEHRAAGVHAVPRRQRLVGHTRPLPRRIPAAPAVRAPAEEKIAAGDVATALAAADGEAEEPRPADLLEEHGTWGCRIDLSDPLQHLSPFV